MKYQDRSKTKADHDRLRGDQTKGALYVLIMVPELKRSLKFYALF